MNPALPERRQISARIFPEVYDRIEEAAKANHRSLGAEIAYRLEASIRRDREEEAMMQSATLNMSAWPTANRLIREGQTAIAENAARRK